MNKIDYKFDEDRILQDIKDYIDSTYDQHYAQGRIQTNEFIMSHLESNEGFKLNVLKYVTRYGYKKGHNRDDLMKAIHYLIFMMCFHDRVYGVKEIIDEIKETPYVYDKDSETYTPTLYESDTAKIMWDQIERMREDDPIYQLNKKDMEDYNRNVAAWNEALDSIERLENRRKLRKFESPGFDVIEKDV